MRKKKRRAGMRQLHFDHKRHGGWREGSGRKKGGRVSHGKRMEIGRGGVGLVTIKLKEGLRSLRYDAEADAVYGALVRVREKGEEAGVGFRVLEYSVQSNHLHLLVEADGAAELQTGMRRLMAVLGNALRSLWSLRGGLFADRYHIDLVPSPTRMRNALHYVLNNARKHNSWIADAPDPYSSGPWFRGWSGGVPARSVPKRPSPVSLPRTWLASVGWRRAGPSIRFDGAFRPSSKRKPPSASSSGRRQRRPSALASEAS